MLKHRLTAIIISLPTTIGDIPIVKNIEHPKPTISSPKKGDENSRHFQRGFPPVPQPRRGQASQQGRVKGRELE